MQEKKYIAFISYRHRSPDMQIARKLQRSLESYRIPADLSASYGAKKLGRVYRDETELPLAANLTEELYGALDASEYLLVVCTKNTLKSEWVEKETEYFLKHHERDHVFVILAEGTPETSVPPILTQLTEEEREEGRAEIEPLAANLSGKDGKYDFRRFNQEIVRVYATILGCEYDHLWQRQRRQAVQRTLRLSLAGMAVSLLFAFSLWRTNAQITERNRQIEAQNEEISGQNAQIEEQNGRLRKNEAEALLGEGQLLYENGDISGAVRDAMAVLNSEAGNESFRAEAEYLLWQSLGAGRFGIEMRTTLKIEQNEPLAEIALSGDGTVLYTIDEKGYIRCFGTEDGEVIWETDGHYALTPELATTRKRLYVMEQAGVLVNCNKDGIAVFSLEDGSLLWEKAFNLLEQPDFFCFSEDGRKIAYLEPRAGVLDQEAGEDTVGYWLVLADTADGSVQKEVELPCTTEGLDAMESIGNQTGILWEDGRYIAISLYYRQDFSRYRQLQVYLVDTETGTADTVYTEDYDADYAVRFVIGVDHPEGSGRIRIMYYDEAERTVTLRELSPDGEEGLCVTERVTVPDVWFAGSVPVSYVASASGYVMAACGLDVFFLEPGEETLETGSFAYGAPVQLAWIDEAKGSRMYYYSDGTVVTFSGYSYSMAREAKQEYLLLLENAGRDRGGNGTEPMLQALVYRSDPSAVYIRRPAKDGNIQALEGFCGSSEYSYSMAQNGDRYIQCVDDLGEVTFIVADAESKAVLQRYHYTKEEAERMFSFYFEQEKICYWPGEDGRFSYMGYSSDRGPVICRFGETGGQEIFENIGQKGIVRATAARATDGGVLQVCVTDNWEGDCCSLLWRTELGEVHESISEAGAEWARLSITAEDTPREQICIGANGLIAIPQCNRSYQVNGFFAADTKTEEEYLIPASAAGEELLSVGDTDAVILTADEAGVLRIYNVALKRCVWEERMPGAAPRINSACLFDGGSKLAVLLADRHLIVYDREGHEILYDTYLDQYYIFGTEWSKDAEQSLSVFEDPAHERVYFKSSAGHDFGIAIGVDTRFWVKTSDIDRMAFYNAELNELLTVGNLLVRIGGEDDLVLYHPAYTLEELMEWAEHEESF